jgi:PAS domain S-box-containing protein
MQKTLSKKPKLSKEPSTIKRSEERYHKMIAEVQDYAIILLDRNGIIQNWNKGAEKIKQYTEAEIVGKHFGIFYLPEDRKNKLPEKLIQEALEEGRAMHEGWRLRKDGSQFWGSIVITALHDEKNKIIGFSKVTRDLTERKIAADKMQNYTTELEIQNKELEQFAYVASHDLQEPLRKIQTFASVIQKNTADELLVKRYLDKINASANRMSQLIKSVLNYSGLSAHEDQIVETDLNSVLEVAKTDLELLIAEKHATIKNEILPTLPGIPLQLSQLFTNLIGNSLKFTDEHPAITISSKVVKPDEIVNKPETLPNRRYVELSFADNGIGFEKEYEKQIFSIFQRLSGKQHYPGTGIGLALCKKIVENHKGFITAKSELGKGATFYVYLPA